MLSKCDTFFDDAFEDFNGRHVVIVGFPLLGRSIVLPSSVLETISQTSYRTTVPVKIFSQVCLFGQIGGFQRPSCKHFHKVVTLLALMEFALFKNK